MKMTEIKITMFSFSFFVPLIWGLKMRTEKGGVIGMRKEALEVREKTTNPTFVDLYPPSTIPFTTLYPPFLYHVFGKKCGIKKRSGKDRCRNDYKFTL